MKNKMKKAALSSAERSKVYRERKNAESNKTKQKSLTNAEKVKSYQERKTTFDVVQLHLISNECEKQGNVNFSFESRPHQEHIYFNFYGTDYKHDVYRIAPNGNIHETKKIKYFLSLIKYYEEEHQEIEVIDEINIKEAVENDNFKEIPWGQRHFEIVVNSKQEAEKISELCHKFIYAKDVEGMLKYPFNINTREEIVKIIDHWKNPNPELKTKTKTMTCHECGKQCPYQLLYPEMCEDCLKRLGITHNVINNAMIGYMKKHDYATYTYMKNHDDETTGHINW